MEEEKKSNRNKKLILGAWMVLVALEIALFNYTFNLAGFFLVIAWVLISKKYRLSNEESILGGLIFLFFCLLFSLFRRLDLAEKMSTWALFLLVTGALQAIFKNFPQKQDFISEKPTLNLKNFLLSVVIPVYNEEKTIVQVIKRVQKIKLRKEIIIVDDGSTDKTRKILSQIKTSPNLKIFFHSKNKGKGAAVRTSLKKARGDAVVIQDADFEYYPQDYLQMFKLIAQGADVVYGNRFAKMKFRLWGEERIVFPHFYLGVRALSLATSLLYGIFPPLADVETCYKMLSKKAYQSLKLTSNGFEIEIEITSKILKNGFKIIEVPIRYQSRSYKEGKKITWKDGLKAFGAIAKFRFKD